MSRDSYTGIIGNDRNNTVGAWLVDNKAGRERSLGIVTQNFPGVANDMSYLGYFVNQRDPKGKGCNFSIALEEDAVRIQSIHPETGAASNVSIPVDKFFDLLDMLSVMDIAKIAADYAAIPVGLKK